MCAPGCGTWLPASIGGRFVSNQATEEMMRLKQDASDKRRYLKVRPKEGGPWAVIQSHELVSTLDDDEIASYEMADVWLTKAEYDALAEFAGW
jgi:hypothetical protein